MTFDDPTEFLIEGCCVTCDTISEVRYFSNSFRDLNVIHVNICGITTNFNNLLAFLQSLEVDFDLVVLSETHIFNNIQQFHIAGYDTFYNESKINRCDGTIIYAKSGLVLHSEIIIINETKFLRITLEKNSVTIGVVAHYRLPSLSQDTFISDLELLLGNFNQCSVEIFVGDTNLNILDARSKNISKYLGLLGSFGYKNLINDVTRTDGDTKTCIDHFAVKINNKKYINETNSVILRSSLSDHYPILLNLKLHYEKQSITPQTLKFKEKIDKLRLTELLQNETWQDILQSGDPNQVAEKLVNKLQNILQKCKTKQKIKSKTKRLKPWITEGLVTSIRNRDKLKRSLARNPHNNEALKKYKLYRNMLSKLLNSAKIQYYKNSISKNKKKPKKLWETFREITNQDPPKNLIKTIINDQGVEISDSLLMADAFNEFFRTVGSTLAGEINVPSVKTRETKKHTRTIFLNPITDNELILQINDLKNGSVGGEDGVSVEILKSNHVYLIKPIRHLVNGVFSTGVFPDIFKKSIIIPIYKSGEKKEKTNYRPIALTSTISKIIEKCIKLRLYQFLEREKLLSPFQFGFREGHSAEDAIAEVTDFIVGSFNEGYKPLAVFLDLSKAFDTVEHHTLLQKLENFGIRGIALELFKSYLSNRTQSVKIRDSISQSGVVECGVPQGTVLGPILFLIYVNSITQMANNGRIICFADDTALLVRDRTWRGAFDKCEEAMAQIKHWLDSNLLTLNSDKTHFLTFSKTKRDLPDKEYFVLHNNNCKIKTTCKCNQKITRKDNIKYLGVFFDQCMTWQNHVNYVNKKLRSLLYKFYELRQVLPYCMIKNLYQALVESILTYGITAWGASCKNVLKSLFVTQKYILKIMLFKKKRYSTTLLFKEANILSLRQLYIKNIIRFSFSNPKFNNIISHHSIGTRANKNNNLNLPKALFSSTQRHISFILPKIINVLPNYLKVNVNYNKIKNRIDSWIVENFGDICKRIPILK